MCGYDGVGECAGPLNACHIISRRYSLTRCNKQNGVSLCVKHHRMLDGAAEPHHLALRWLEYYLPGRKDEMWKIARNDAKLKVKWQTTYDLLTDNNTIDG